MNYVTFLPEGAKAHGTVSQSKFLQELGINHRFESLMSNPNLKDEERNTISSGYEKLLSPKEMGELFKVLAVSSKSITGQLVGFS